MNRSLLQTAWIVLFLTILSTTPAEAQRGARLVSLGRLFNAAVNLGWLREASNLRMHPREHRNYARAAAREFNAAFRPPRREAPPPPTVSGAAAMFTRLAGDLARGGGGNRSQMANYAMQGGWHLAVAHIQAQYGRCARCVRKSMDLAGWYLIRLGQGSNVSRVTSIGRHLKDTAGSMRARTPPEVQAYTKTLAQAITGVARAL